MSYDGIKQGPDQTANALTRQALADHPPRRGAKSKLRHQFKRQQEDAVITTAQRLLTHKAPTLVTAFLMCPVQFKPPQNFFDVLEMAFEKEILTSDDSKSLITDLAQIWADKIAAEQYLRTHEDMQSMAFLGAVKKDGRFWDTSIHVWD